LIDGMNNAFRCTSEVTCRNNVAGKPAHAARRPGRMTRAAPTRHRGVCAHKKRGAWATPSVDDNHGAVHRDTVAGNWVRGSIPLSDGGSFGASAGAGNNACSWSSFRLLVPRKLLAVMAMAVGLPHLPFCPPLRRSLGGDHASERASPGKRASRPDEDRPGLFMTSALPASCETWRGCD